MPLWISWKNKNTSTVGTSNFQPTTFEKPIRLMGNALIHFVQTTWNVPILYNMEQKVQIILQLLPYRFYVGWRWSFLQFFLYLLELWTELKGRTNERNVKETEIYFPFIRNGFPLSVKRTDNKKGLAKMLSFAFVFLSSWT